MHKLRVKTHFDAAHRLHGYEGDCANLHGHRWNVEVVLSGISLDKLGMVVDFKEVKTALKKILYTLDHSVMLSSKDTLTTSDLKDSRIAWFNRNPTAEVIAKHIFYRLTKELHHNKAFHENYVLLEKVIIWETPECAVEYDGEEQDKWFSNAHS